MNNNDNEKPFFDPSSFVNINNNMSQINTPGQPQEINKNMGYQSFSPTNYDMVETKPLSQPSLSNQNYDDFTMDVPPMLGEIPNLNQATKAVAPTGDVLDPMNIMPEKVNPVDVLDAYEMNIPISNIPNISNDYVLNQTQNSSGVDSISMDLKAPTLPSNEENLFYNMPTNETSINNIDTGDDLYFQNLKLNEHTDINSSLDPLPKIEPIDFKNDVEDLDTLHDENTSQIDNDMLAPEDEILDIKPISLPEIDDKGMVSNSINKIKQLINELNENGANIRLEEFDFEQMYQIIIKIDK